MKKITLLALLLFVFGAHAQNHLIYGTNFPAGGAPTGWTTQILGFEGETNWYFGDTYLPPGGNFSAPAAIFNDDISFDFNSWVSLTSPAFDTSGYDTLQLSFEYALSQTSDRMGYLSVEVYNGTRWLEVMMVYTNTLPVNTGLLDMTAHKNSAFQVRYTYNDQNSSTWGAGVTDFKIEGTYTVVPNDLIANAFPLTCGQSLPGTTITATQETGVPVCNGVDGNTHGVWYKFSNPLNRANVTVSLCNSTGSLDTRLSIFKGDISALTCVTANDNSCGNLSSAEFAYDGYSDYYILVSGEGGTTGDFTISAGCTTVAPENDAIVNAIDVDQFEQPYTHHAVPLIYATTEDDFADLALTGCDTGQQQNVFYKFTTTGPGTATVSMGTPNVGGLTLITFYTAPNENAALANLTWVNQPTNSCNNLSANRSITTVANQTYYVTVMQPDTNSDVNILITDDTAHANNIELQWFNYYPNPVNNELHISAKSSISQIVLYNLIGQKIKEYTPNAINATLRTDGLSAGTYLLKATVNGTTGTYKIIKQ